MTERAGLAQLAADLWFVGQDSRATVGRRIVTVLAVLNTTPPREMPALDIARTAGLPSGVVESTLRRLVEIGWVDRRWEPSAPRHGHARRYVHKLAAAGARRAISLDVGIRNNKEEGAHHG